MERTISDDKAREFWEKCFLVMLEAPGFQECTLDATANTADLLLGDWADRFGTEELRTEIEQFEQARIAKNTPDVASQFTNGLRPE